MQAKLTFKPIEILLIEDNPGDVILIREALNEARISNNLHVAKDGEVAMQNLRGANGIVNAEYPGLILLDLNMPKKDGRTVLKELKQDERLKDIPVIIMTSSKAEADIIRTYSLQAAGYVVKPLTPESFINAISSVQKLWINIVVLTQD